MVRPRKCHRLLTQHGEVLRGSPVVEDWYIGTVPEESTREDERQGKVRRELLADTSSELLSMEGQQPSEYLG